ncbi:RTase [Trichonephila clavipes]|nr:RTase [Trichonephila clavipes]
MFSIGGKALTLDLRFLEKQTSREKFNYSLSRSFSLFQGVSQGSALSPTLILASTYQALRVLSTRKCKVGAFADDIVLWKSDYDLTKLERDINLVLEDIRNFNSRPQTDFLTVLSPRLASLQPLESCIISISVFLYVKPLTVDKHPKYLGLHTEP